MRSLLDQMSEKERSHHEIKRISESDERAFEMLSNFCYATEEQLLETGISKNRINSYLLNSIIEESKDYKHSYYRTTEEGRHFLKSHGYENPYVSNGFEHDQKLMEIYNSLSEEEQETWMNQNELQREFNSLNEGYSVCDAAYVSGDELVVVEVATGNYSDADIESHESYAECVGGSFALYEI